MELFRIDYIYILNSQTTKTKANIIVILLYSPDFNYVHFKPYALEIISNIIYIPCDIINKQ